MQEDTRRKIKEFEKKYFNLIEKATKLFYKGNIKEKRQDLPTTTLWQLGNMFRKFYDNVYNQFYITNYANALQRDFGRTEPYIRELIIFVREFKKEEVTDDIPMAVYRALIWKRNQLDKLKLFEKEKEKLIKRGKTKQFIGRENYKKELKELIKQYSD